ncbi:MAG: hypothetical protein ABL958_12015 [Bdellovibrionia bacterium]
MRLRQVLTCVGLVLFVPTASFSANKSKSRLEDLFVWRVSDTLSLTPDVEAKFSTEFKRLSEKKAKLGKDIDDVLADIEKSKDQAKVDTQLKTYKEKLTEQSRISLEEVESFEKLFGKQKFAQYLVLKRDLTQKLKDFVSTPSKDSSGSKNLSNPKIIQDEGH